jgi:hypothetical protein
MNILEIKYPEIGICGLSCRLCPWYHKEGENRCGGCKTEFRLAVGCTFIRCAVKKKGLEFCWECDEAETCEKWEKHRKFSKITDSFKCYQKLEDDIAFIYEQGVDEFEKVQKTREGLLKEMLQEFNEGRSKSYFCIAATVLELDELQAALEKARKKSEGLDIKKKSKVLHSILDEIAKEKNYLLKLRK